MPEKEDFMENVDRFLSIENDGAEENFNEIIGSSAALRFVRPELQRVESTNSSRDVPVPEPQETQEKLYPEEQICSGMKFHNIVGTSPALRQVLELVDTVASSDSTVLLLGETGTGKELIARAIHDRSRRKQRRFVKLNCAAIPTGLLESELFGHEKGAFTGAITQKIGRLDLADQGTL